MFDDPNDPRVMQHQIRELHQQSIKSVANNVALASILAAIATKLDISIDDVTKEMSRVYPSRPNQPIVTDDATKIVQLILNRGR